MQEKRLFEPLSGLRCAQPVGRDSYLDKTPGSYRGGAQCV